MRKLLVAATILAVFTAGSAFAKTVRIGVTQGRTLRSWRR